MARLTADTDEQTVIRRLVETLDFISQEARRERRGLRFSEPTPIHGVDAGLTLIELAADTGLGRDSPLTRSISGRPAAV